MLARNADTPLARAKHHFQRRTENERRAIGWAAGANKKRNSVFIKKSWMSTIWSWSIVDVCLATFSGILFMCSPFSRYMSEYTRQTEEGGGEDVAVFAVASARKMCAHEMHSVELVHISKSCFTFASRIFLIRFLIGSTQPFTIRVSTVVCKPKHSKTIRGLVCLSVWMALWMCVTL